MNLLPQGQSVAIAGFFSLAMVFPASSQGPLLLKEVSSREYSIQTGVEETATYRQAFSREVSFQIENGPLEPSPEVLSREFSLVVTSPEPPAQVLDLAIDVSPTGETVILDWSNYNQWAEGDISHFDVYYTADGPFDDVSVGTLQKMSVSAGTTFTSVSGLPAFTDHFFAVVAVDALGNFNPAVTYSAGYVLAPEIISREISLLVENGSAEPFTEVISREFSLVVTTSDPPTPIADLALTVSPTGETVTLDWSSYNQWAEQDIAHFDIYHTDSGPFSDVTVPGLTKVTIPAGQTMATLESLTPFTDHYFAVVPVDALGNFQSQVTYSAVYVLSPEVISRELTLAIENGPAESYPNVQSREVSILVPDSAAPAPVTGLESGFFVETSTTAFGAVDLDWMAYNEPAQLDVSEYRIFFGASFFDTVTESMMPIAVVPAGTQRFTLPGLAGGEIFHFAVVAADPLGNFDPNVRSFSAKTSVSAVGEVLDLVGTSGPDTISFTWMAPPDTEAFRTAYHIYFDGAEVPEVLPPNATSWNATGLVPETGYLFKIATVDGFGNESDGITVQAATWLANPASLALTTQGDDVFLEWSGVQPGALVRYYAIYQRSAPFTDITGLLPVSISLGTNANLGTFATVDGDYFAVATVNVLDGTNPIVSPIQVAKLNQTIDFPELIPGPLSMPLEATASSGLPVRFEASPNHIAVIEEDTLFVQQGGPISVNAIQDGDANYWPASASQMLRLPPVFVGVTANGAPLVDHTILTRNTEFIVDVRDVEVFSQAMFFWRTPGGAWQEFHTEFNEANNLTGTLGVDLLADGPYELRFWLQTSSGQTVERVYDATLSLQPILTLALSDALGEDESLTGQASIQRARPEDLLVTLSSSRPTQLDVGPPVTIPAGQTETPFTITGIQDELVEAPIDIQVRANTPGAQEVSRLVTLADDDWPALILSLSRTTVPESAGPSAVTAVITRDPGSSQPLTVWLTNSNPRAAVVPEKVVIPANQTEAEFPIGAVDDDLADGTETSDLRGEVRLGGLGTIVESNLVSLSVGDDEGATLEIVYDRGWLMEGTSDSVTLRRQGASTASALTVNLTKDVSGELDCPPSVEIPAGASETTFPITGLDDGVADGTTPVIVTATATGYGPGQVSIAVTDELLPDLIATDLDIPTSIETEANAVVSYRIENRGSGPSALPFVQRVWFSKDSVLGDDLLLSQYTFAGTLNPEVGFGRSETIRAPRESGEYWLLVTADAGLSVPELIESNNTALFAQPITVNAAYNAIVATDATLVPANTPIIFTGSASNTNGKVPFVLVNIHIRVGATERIIAALTDSAGNFEATWNPLPGEGGDYEIGAVHPGVSEAATQDTFAILTVRPEFPEETLRFEETASASITGQLTNPTAYDLTGLTLDAMDAPPGLTVDVTLPSDQLGPGQSVQAGVAFTAAEGFFGNHTVTLHLSTDQGVMLDIPLVLEVAPLIPKLTITPNPLRCSVVRGTQKAASVSIVNVGGAETGPISVLLPELSFLSLASPPILDSLLPGEEAAIDLLLEPSDAEALTLFNGHMVLSLGNGSPVNLPFAFRVVSDLMGDLEIDVVDEYFYFTAEAPKVAGATVVVRDAITSDEIARQISGTEGLASFPDLLEGWYTIEVDTPNHTRWRGNLFVDAGETTRRQVFISREMVTYTWTVEEVEIEDRYKVTVESTFETNVPVPVVTVEPSVLELEDVNVLGQTKVVNFTFENHGFINADHGKLEFGSHPFYEITPLIEDIGTIPAKSSITIPVTVRRVGEFADDGSIRTLNSGSVRALRVANATAGKTPVPCTVQGRLEWDYICGIIPVAKFTPIPGSGVEGHCPGGEGRPIRPSGRGGGGAVVTPVGIASSGSSCLPCFKPIIDCAFAAAGCFPQGFLISCIYGALDCVRALATDGVTAGSAKDCLVSGYGCIPGSNCIVGISNCLLNLAICIDENSGGGGGGGFLRLAVVETPLFPTSDPDPFVAAAFQLGNDRLTPFVDLMDLLLGERDATLLVSDQAFVDWITALLTKVRNVDGNLFLDDTAILDLRQTATAAGLDLSMVDRIIDRLNRTADYYNQSIFTLEDVPSGESQDFIPLDQLETNLNAAGEAISASIENGFAGPQEELTFAIEQAQDARTGGDGVCARVKIEIDQEAVMTRSAFKANLELTNNLEQNALTEVGFDLQVSNASGEPANDVFNIRVSTLEGLSAIDGTGEILPRTSGRAEWTLIPRDTAAPLADTIYTIGGTISYVQNGTEFSIPVEPVEITVRPDAALFLKYFHQRDVFSDDPHTDPIEPSIPYSLAVMVENRGAGAARNLSITSAQPEIVENEKGLLIDFQIIGTQVAGQNLSPSLTANFGDIAPMERKVGTWLITSTLQGLFIDYNATFEHLDGFGDPRLSLIKEVEIHEMIHMIEALESKADGLPDFLVNDVADINDLPDTVHLSNGTTEPVMVYESATTGGAITNSNLSTTLTASLGSGWSYLRVPEPADGAFRLVRVERSDGLEIPLDKNVWTTDRTFIGLGRRPIYENILHLVDCNSTGSFTLFYEPLSGADVTAPESMVTMLDAQSLSQIPVQWTGMDDQGIGTYDIFVSIDGAPFELWLENTRRTSGIYEGETGKQYAFYSVARDFSGNEESAPGAADAFTTVSLSNQAPVVDSIANQTITEGETFVFTAIAIDPDDDTIRYDVSSESDGLIIDGLTGEMRWITGESDGSRVLNVTVTATDDGLPPLMGTADFTITVLDENRAPVIDEVPGQLIGVEEILLVDIDAIDTDEPAQILSYTLSVGAPLGMEIDSNTGVLSWVPGRDVGGLTYVVEVTVTDNGTPPQSSRIEFPVTVAEATDRAPVFDDEIPVVLWLRGKSYTLAVSADDPDGDPVSLSADLGALIGQLEFQDLGAGHGQFDWPSVNAADGVYQVPVNATANGLSSSGSLTIRVAEDNLYWNWAVERLAGRATLADIELNADPDGDNRDNVTEMVFLTDPMQSDEMALDGGTEVTDPWVTTELLFKRQMGSQDYLRIFPLRSSTLLDGSWERLDDSAWDAMVLEQNAIEGTETIRIQVFEFDPAEELIRLFYGLGTEEVSEP